MLIPDLSEAVIIGAATLQKWRMKLDFDADEVIIDPRVTKLRLMKSLSRAEFPYDSFGASVLVSCPGNTFT